MLALYIMLSIYQYLVIENTNENVIQMIFGYEKESKKLKKMSFICYNSDIFVKERIKKGLNSKNNKRMSIFGHKLWSISLKVKISAIFLP